MSHSPTPSSYAAAGVDIDAANTAVNLMKSHIKRTETPGVLSGIGSFGGMFALSSLGKFNDAVLVSSIDGVGTKLYIAIELNKHDTIGKDLVNHCVNDILVQGARPLLFLDYLGVGKIDPEVASEIVKGLSDACVQVECALIGGETAEMPGLYKPGDYDLAGCIVGIVERSKIVNGDRIEAGDVVLGVESNGLHTNGYSLARSVLLNESAYALADRPDELLGETVGEVLLAQHRCYAPAILPLLELVDVKGMAHITGGGFMDNIPRILPPGLGVAIDCASWQVPPIFKLIQQTGKVHELEMFRVFNMGIGFVVIVSEQEAEDALHQLINAGERAHRIGKVTFGSGISLSHGDDQLPQ